MDDRQFWTAIRRALLMAVSAIDSRYGLGSSEGRSTATSAPRERASIR